MMGRRGEKMKQMAARWGVWFLVLGALTPLNFAVCVWSVSALGMRHRTFTIVTLLRIPRVLFYTWLIQVGFMSGT